jgi:hypothetical protein
MCGGAPIKVQTALIGSCFFTYLNVGDSYPHVSNAKRPQVFALVVELRMNGNDDGNYLGTKVRVGH